MLELCTGKPGASKSLNTLASLIASNQGNRPIYYTNVRLLMLDYNIASSFSGWFYGNYSLFLKNKGAKKRLAKIIKRVHADDEFLTLADVPWLESYFEAANPVDTWLLWARKLYSKKQLSRMEEFISNMPSDELKFEHLKQFNLHFNYFHNPREWHLLPKTSIIFIDECQQFFPPRAAGSTVPIHVTKFETHRHDGYDIHLVTQDRMLLDSNVRKLVNRHIHYHNPFGGNRVTRFEQSKSFDSDNYFDLKVAQKTFVKRPVKLYGSYFSSEMHTHKFKLPNFVYAFVLLVIFIAYTVYSLATSSLFSSAETEAAIKTDSNGLVVKESKVTHISPRSSLLSPDENKVLTAFVQNTIEDVFISGSQYIKDVNGVVRYDYSFVQSTTDLVFEPEAVGFEILPITACLVRLNFNDFTTFITCNPFYKHTDKDPVIDSETPSDFDLLASF
ncbi:MAG: zonular occludens toxin [Inoviridae sp.]|nr:MAG: zonular occludens toxin [Inoviridae sp.]